MSSLGSSTDLHGQDRVSNGLNGRRILVIEDSPVVSPFTVDILAELGCMVVGPAPNMAVAREMVPWMAFASDTVSVSSPSDERSPITATASVDDIDPAGIVIVPLAAM